MKWVCFFGTLKAELLNDQPGRCFESKALAKWLVADYIDHFYKYGATP